MNTKYLKYAIGEIFLVVIGILIALSIDNWNENRKERIQLEGYLKTIQKNIQADTAEIKSVQTRYHSLNDAAKDFMEMIFKNEVDERIIGRSLNVLAEGYTIIDQSGFESLKSSGAIKDLQGTAIEDALFEYYNSFENARQQEVSMNNFIEALEARLFSSDSKELIEILRWGLSLEGVEKGELNMPKEQMLRVLAMKPEIIGIMQRMADEDSPRYEIMLEKAIQVLSLLETELEK